MDLALTGGTVYVSADEEPIRDGLVLIRDTKIAAVGRSVEIPANAQHIDCSGRNVGAGFCNSHVHFFERKWSDAASIPADELTRQLEDAFARFGFTSVFDLGSSLANTNAIRDRIESGEVKGPRIRTCGEGLVPAGGNPPDIVLQMMGLMKTPLPEIASAQEAVTAVKDLLARGADGIKLFASTPRGASLSEEMIAAAVDEAHLAGKPVFVHPNNFTDVQNALRAGADVIAHTTPSSAWTEVGPGGAALTPTLTLWRNAMRHDRISTQEKFTRAAIDQLKSWRNAGGRIVFGTDLGAVDSDPRGEYELMAEAGMTFRDILRSLTTDGRIAIGHDADICAFNDLADVSLTIRSGEKIFERRVDFPPSRSTSS